MDRVIAIYDVYSTHPGYKSILVSVDRIVVICHYEIFGIAFTLIIDAEAVHPPYML